MHYLVFNQYVPAVLDLPPEQQGITKNGLDDQIPPATVPMTQPEINQHSATITSMQIHILWIQLLPEYFESTWSHRDTKMGDPKSSKLYWSCLTGKQMVFALRPSY